MSDESLFEGSLDNPLNFLDGFWWVRLYLRESLKLMLDIFLLLTNLATKVGHSRAICVHESLHSDEAELGKSVEGRLDWSLQTRLKGRYQIFVIHVDDRKVEILDQALLLDD